MTLAVERATTRSLIRKIKQTDFTRRFHVRQTGTIANGPFARAFHRRDRSRIRTPGLVPRNEKPEEKPIEPLTESLHPYTPDHEVGLSDGPRPPTCERTRD